jgi:hypothetical protein
MYKTITVGKSRPTIWAVNVIVKNTVLRKQSPNSRKFDQSGHPVGFSRTLPYFENMYPGTRLLCIHIKLSTREQGCQIFLGTTCNKHLPLGRKKTKCPYIMNTNIFHRKTLQNVPKLGFWVLKYISSGKPAMPGYKSWLEKPTSGPRRHTVQHFNSENLAAPPNLPFAGNVSGGNSWRGPRIRAATRCRRATGCKQTWGRTTEPEVRWLWRRPAESERQINAISLASALT